MKKPKAAAVNEENAAAEVAAKEAANKVVAIETSVIADQSSSTATCSSSAALNTSATSSLGSDKQETPATTQPPQFTLAQIAAQAVESRRASQLLSRISESSSVSQRGDEAATSSGSEASFPVHHNRTVATGSSSSKQTPKLNPRSSLVDHSHHHHHHHHHHHNLHARLATRKSSLDLPSSTQLLNAVANSSAIAASAAAAAAAATPASISNPITSRYVQQQQQYLQQQQQQQIHPQTASASQAIAKQQARKSIDPSQVFLQLYQQAPYLHGGGEQQQQQQQQRDTPLLIPEGGGDQNLSLIVRKMALHADMTARIYRSQKDNNTVYGGKWYDRLKQINRIRKLVNEHNAKQPQQQQQQQQQQAQHMQQPLAAFQRIARFNTANQVVGPAASNSLPPPLASSSSAGSNLNQMNFTNYI